jgi:hypothetical protein
MQCTCENNQLKRWKRRGATALLELHENQIDPLDENIDLF